MLRKLIGVVFVLLLSVTSALMQDTDPSTDIIIYGVDKGQLASLTSDALTNLAKLSVPAVMNHDIPDPYPWSYALSPDRTRLLFIFTERNKTTYYVANVTTGGCCLKLDPQDKDMDSLPPTRPAFSPDGTQVAVAYTSSAYEAPPQVVAYNVATGAVVDRLRAVDAPSVEDGSDPILFQIIDWTDKGVGIVPAACCQLVTSGDLTRWIPQEDVNQPATFGPETEPFALGEQRLGTGESLSVEADWDYPAASADGLYVPRNVVVYQAPSIESQVIYVNPTDTGIGGAYWVADGQAILITRVKPEEGQPLQQAILLARDGTETPLELAYGETFLAGTSDGWITRGMYSGALIAYHLGDEISQASIGDFERRVVVLSAPTLGLSLEDAEPFAEVPAP